MRTSALTKAGTDRLHQAMTARVQNGGLPGIVTMVAQGDDVHVDVIGSMAFGSDQPMQRDAIFRVTSMTKPILGAATMLLVDDGRLALDEPVSRLLPELADRRVLKSVDGPLDETVPAARRITVEDLLYIPPWLWPHHRRGHDAQSAVSDRPEGRGAPARHGAARSAHAARAR